MTMALIGVMYGVQMGSIMGAAYELSGGDSMVLTLGLGLLCQGVGSIPGHLIGGI